MRYNYFFKATLPVFALLLAACSSDDDLESGNNNNNTTPVATSDVFSASIESGKVSRTTLETSEGNVLWSLGDKIGVYYNSETTPKQFDIKDGVGKNVATFTMDNFHFSDATTDFFALYPYQSAATITSAGALSATLPSTQTAVENGVDPTAMLMTGHATAENKTFAFKNIPALLKITVKSSSNFNINAVRFVANSTDATISGAFTATIAKNEDRSNDGLPSSITGSGTNSVVLNMTASTDSKTYYISVLPGTLTGGFTLLLIDDTNKKAVQRISNTDLTLKSSEITDLGTFEASSSEGDVVLYNNSTRCLVLDGVVDLGLPSGTLWCTKNVGATSETAYGKYYAWGENFAYGESYTDGSKGAITEVGNFYDRLIPWYGSSNTKEAYTWRTYKWGHGTVGLSGHRSFSDNDGVLGKYNDYSKYATTECPVDNLTELESADDAATIENKTHVTPSADNARELVANINVGSKNSNNAFPLTSEINGKSISLPAAGNYYYVVFNGLFSDNEEQDINEKARYWTRTRDTGVNSYKAFTLDIDAEGKDCNTDQRRSGKTIRPVIRKVNFTKKVQQ